MKNYKDSLKFLESADIIRKRMTEVNEMFLKHKLPVVKSDDSKNFIMLVFGGEVILTSTQKGHKLEIRVFPYQPVILKQESNSTSWKIASGNKASIRNAYRSLDLLYMNEEVLENYIYHIISKHKL